MSTIYTLEMLNTLEIAIATGARECYYGDKRVSYRSLDEMLKIKGIMEQELFPDKKPARRKLAVFNKGLDSCNEFS